MNQLLNKYNFLFLFLFIISFGLIVKQNYPYWDDYVLFNQSYETLYPLYHDHGTHYFGITYLICFINAIVHNILWIRILNFALFIGTAYMFCRILKEFFQFKKESLYIIFCLFIFLPFFQIRSSYNVLVYNLCFLLFAIATYLYFKKHFKLALCFFMIAFITNSFIPLFIFVFFLVHGLQFYKQLLHLIIVPVFWLYKIYIAHSNGVFALEAYNKVGLKSIRKAMFSMDNVLKDGYINFKNYFLSIDTPQWYIIPCLFIIIIIVLFKYKISIQFSWQRRMIFMLGAIFLIFLGIFPYAIVSKMPSGLFYESRFQMLLSIGFSLFIFSLYELFYFCLPWLANIFFSALIALFVFFNYSFQKDLLINSMEQIRVFEYVQKHFKDNQSLLLKINSVSPIFYDIHVWRIYEYGAYCKLHNFKQNKIVYYNTVLTLEEIEANKKINYYFVNDFNTKDYTIDSINVNFARTKLYF